MEKPTFITIEEIVEILDFPSLDNNYKAADILQEAINSWPDRADEPSELLIALEKEVGFPLTYKNLQNHLEFLTPAYDAWKMEAISVILKLFDLYHDNNKIEMDLRYILKILTNNIRR